MYGAIVIEPADGERIRANRDYVVQLSDWTDEDPMRVLAKLKVQSDVYNFNQPTVVDFLRDVSHEGMRAALDKRQMWNEMRMNPTDLADLSTYALTYLINGITPAGNWTALFRPGERVRLRELLGRDLNATDEWPLTADNRVYDATARSAMLSTIRPSFTACAGTRTPGRVASTSTCGVMPLSTTHSYSARSRYGRWLVICAASSPISGTRHQAGSSRKFFSFSVRLRTKPGLRKMRLP